MTDENEDLQSWGWTDLSSYSSSPSDSETEQRTGVMSRCSLRLDEGLLDRSLLRGSGSYSVGGVSLRSSRSVRTCHSQRPLAFCSESLLLSTPHKAAGESFHNSSLQSQASDALLISSLLDESSIQESTLVDTFWGLDQDGDPKESTMVAEEGSALIGSDNRCAKHPDHNVSRDGSIQADTSTVYCRDWSRRSETARPDRRGAAMSPTEHRAVGSLCRAAGDVFRWSCRRWNHMTSNSHLTRLFLRLFVVLAPLMLLLLFSVDVTVDIVPGLSSLDLFSQSQSAEESSQESLHSRAPGAELPPAQSDSCHMSSSFKSDWLGSQQVVSHEVSAAPVSERLNQVENSLVALWEQVEAAGRRAEQRHGEVLQLYTHLMQQLSHSASDGVTSRISGLMDQQLFQLRRRLNKEKRHVEQTRLQDLLLLKSQTSRLDHLELQLQTLAARTQDLQWTPEATTLPPAVSAGMDRRSHDALQAEVLRLEAALGDVMQDVQVLSSCQNSCQQLDGVQQTISEQVSILVREEVRDLVYGNQLTSDREATALPASLLEWLSQRFISERDLQGALSSLELNILQDIRRQAADAVLHAAMNPGNAVTKEDVDVMVKDALRLFSQDRIGRADYALESGGGSILSTRCSETYQTKAALLSLFGVPLWYFSQSPRAVIQPDVHPGNCWAFKGSTGFLVIQLSMKILPTAVTMEHIPKSLAPSGTLLSAPRDFRVHGLRDKNQEGGKLLGTYTYEKDGEDLQTFNISEENEEPFQIIEVQVLSNWGHLEYTCMYRVRVHGTPSDV